MADDFEFYPATGGEYQKVQAGIRPRHLQYDCGACGQPNSGRLIASTKREGDGAILNLCVCSCPKAEPAILTERGGKVVAQIPEVREFHVGENWPADLAQLYDEAAKAFAAGAYTAAAMLCRKVLMACACHEGDTDGKSFGAYVDYITQTVLTFPKAKDAIDKIRNIGNEANHRVQMVSRDNARRAMSIVNYMLSTIYSLPSA